MSLGWKEKEGKRGETNGPQEQCRQLRLVRDLLEYDAEDLGLVDIRHREADVDGCTHRMSRVSTISMRRRLIFVRARTHLPLSASAHPPSQTDVEARAARRG